MSFRMWLLRYLFKHSCFRKSSHWEQFRQVVADFRCHSSLGLRRRVAKRDEEICCFLPCQSCCAFLCGRFRNMSYAATLKDNGRANAILIAPFVTSTDKNGSIWIHIRTVGTLWHAPFHGLAEVEFRKGLPNRNMFFESTHQRRFIAGRDLPVSSGWLCIGN